MTLEEAVEKTRRALEQSPASFNEVAERIGYDAPGAIGLTLGTLQARDEVGYSEEMLFALKKDSVIEATEPFSYEAVLASLRQDGPGTFKEISERVAINQPSEIGFALGWLFGEEKILFDGPLGKERWHLRTGRE